MRGIRDKSKTGRAAAVPCVRFFSGYYGLLFGFEACRMRAEAKMAGFCLLPAVFLRTAHCLGRTAAQSVRHPLGNPYGAAEPAVSRLRAALSGRNRARVPPNSFRRCKQDLSLPWTAYRHTPCFFDGDGGNKLPQPARRCCRADAGPRHPCRIQLYAPARRRFAACRIA